MSEIPNDVWRRWTLEEFDPLRQAVLVFGGSLRKEAALEMFTDVSLLYQEGEGIISIKGVFYMTTKRILFLPKNQIPHDKLVEATFDSLKSLTGVRSDSTISLTDKLNGVANFQFSSCKSLFKCFDLLRCLAEASRKSEENFLREVVKIANREHREEVPFSSIEVELSDCVASLDVAESQNTHTDIQQPEEEGDEITAFVTSIKGFFDYCNTLHFDIHIKLRILFAISLFAFCLKFIPIGALIALVIILIILYNAWLRVRNNSEEIKRDSNTNKVHAFLMNYFAWNDEKKTMLVLKISLAIFAGWLVLPNRVYLLTAAVAFALFVVRPLYRSDSLTKIVSGFWFCT